MNRLTHDERRLLVELLTAEAWDLCGRLNPDEWPAKDQPIISARLELVVSARLKLAAALPEQIDSLARCVDETGAQIHNSRLVARLEEVVKP